MVCPQEATQSLPLPFRKSLLGGFGYRNKRWRLAANGRPLSGAVQAATRPSQRVGDGKYFFHYREEESDLSSVRRKDKRTGSPPKDCQSDGPMIGIAPIMTRAIMPGALLV